MTIATSTKLPLFLDIALVLGLLYLLLLSTEANNMPIYHTLGLLTSVLMWLSYPRFILSMSYTAHIKYVFWAWMRVVIMLFVLAFITKTSTEYSRIIIASWSISAAVIQILAHIIIVYFTTPITTANSQTQTLQMELIDRDVDVFFGFLIFLDYR